MIFFLKLSFFMLGLTYDASFLQISQGLFLYDIIFVGMMVFYLAGNGFRVTVRMPRLWLYLAGFFILAHLMTIIVSFIIGYPNLDKETIMFVKFIYLFSLMVFASLTVDEKLVNDALWYFAAGAVAVAALGLYQVVNATSGHMLAGYYYRIGVHDESMLNANTLSIQTSIAGTITLRFFLKEESVLRKWGCYFTVYIFLMGVTFFTFSKGGWMGFVIGTASLLLLNAKRIGFIRLAASFLVFAAMGFLALGNIPFLEKIPEAVSHRLSEGQMTGSFQRLDYFHDVFRFLFMEPVVVLLTGVGFKNYDYMLNEKYQFFAPGTDSHNLLSFLFFGTGLSGAFLVLALFASMFWAAFKCRRIPKGAEGSGGKGALNVNVFISWLAVSTWFSLIAAYPTFSHVFWLMAGMMGRCIYDMERSRLI